MRDHCAIYELGLSENLTGMWGPVQELRCYGIWEGEGVRGKANRANCQGQQQATVWKRNLLGLTIHSIKIFNRLWPSCSHTHIMFRFWTYQKLSLIFGSVGVLWGCWLYLGLVWVVCGGKWGGDPGAGPWEAKPARSQAWSQEQHASTLITQQTFLNLQTPILSAKTVTAPEGSKRAWGAVLNSASNLCTSKKTIHWSTTWSNEWVSYRFRFLLWLVSTRTTWSHWGTVQRIQRIPTIKTAKKCRHTDFNITRKSTVFSPMKATFTLTFWWGCLC